MPKLKRLALALCLLVSVQVSATVFVVPDDRELADKSAGIVIGVIVDSEAKTGRGGIETVYNVQVQRVLKGDVDRDTMLQVASPGGHVGRRWLAVPGSAHFAKGDKVLLFLTQHRGAWTPTDMTLGKFRFVTSSGGQSLLLRDEEDIVGFDKQMRTHVERVRREEDFLQFIEETVRGRQADANYFLSPKDAVALKESDKAAFDVSPNAFSAASYAIHFGSLPGRWADVTGFGGVPARMTAALAAPFFQSTQGTAGSLGDGGIGMLQSSLNGWINDCGSYVNVPYGGTNALFKNAGDDNIEDPGDPEDGINTVIWNDPENDIAGSWGGTGVVATCFIGGADTHTFDGSVATSFSTGWVAISDADVVVQNGLNGTESFVDTALMHEIGHGIGLRHSNTHHDGSACTGSDECTGSAIMNSLVVESLGFTAQTWDINAIRALYPANCATTPAAPTGVVATATGGTTVSVTWSAPGGTITGYRVLRSTDGTNYTQVGADLGLVTNYNDTTAVSGTAYLYIVRALNSTAVSTDSNRDFTVPMSYTDPTLTGQSSLVRAAHFNEARNAVNALRTLAGIGTASFTDTLSSSVNLKTLHLTELRTHLNAARTALGFSAVSFAETLVGGTTTAKTSHITEIRNGLL